MLARLRQRDRDTGPPRSSRAPDAMHIRLGGVRDVVVHHVRDVLHIEPTCRDIGRDQQLGGLRPEALHHAIALILLYGIREGTAMNFESALLLAMFSFISTVAFCRFLLRGDIIE